jgi:hypothetical protein
MSKDVRARLGSKAPGCGGASQFSRHHFSRPHYPAAVLSKLIAQLDRWGLNQELNPTIVSKTASHADTTAS